MKNFFVGLGIVGLALLFFYYGRCDVTCQQSKAIAQELEQAKIQEQLFDVKVQEAAKIKSQYDALMQEAATARVLQWRHENKAESIYGSGLSFRGNVAYAGWDEGIVSEVKQSSFVWRVNSQGQSKHKSELCNDDCTFTGVLNRYGLPTQPFIDNEIKYGVKKELAVCIAWADSHLGKALKSKNNIGNVGNNDRGQTINYATIEDGIEAMYRVLNNKYLGHKQSVGSLSVGGGGSKPYYATSPENRNNNVLNCLNTILDSSITEDRKFRI